MDATGEHFLRPRAFAEKNVLRKALPPGSSRAFTLIEMVTVVAIIAILSILALTSYLQSKKHAYEIMAKHDLRNLIEYEEAYFATTDRYKQYTASFDTPSSVFPGLKLTPGVTLATYGNAAEQSTFYAKGWHEKSTKVYTYHFDTGLFEETPTP